MQTWIGRGLECGRGLNVDWTWIGWGLECGQGLDMDWTWIGRGLDGDWSADMDWTWIVRGLECGRGLDRDLTGIKHGLDVDCTGIGVQAWTTGPQCKCISCSMIHCLKTTYFKVIGIEENTTLFLNCWRCEDVTCVKISWPCITLKHPSESPV